MKSTTKTKPFAILGHPFGMAGNVLGCDQAPNTLRTHGLLKLLQALDSRVTDFGNTSSSIHASDLEKLAARLSPEEQLANNACEVYDACASLFASTAAILAQGMRPMIIGGDHSLSIGSVSAVAEYAASTLGGKIGLLWIDTHADINTPATSPSKNVFGMSVAVLLGKVPGLLASLGSSAAKVAAEHIVYVGLRDLDPAEKEMIKNLGISAYTMQDIDKLGTYAVITRAIEKVSQGTVGFMTSFDLDVCDPKVAPATGTPIRGGFTYRESHLLLETIAEQGNRLLAFELVELNPSLDINEQTTQLALSLLESVAGKTIL